jgi:hypothetical protein
MQCCCAGSVVGRGKTVLLPTSRVTSDAISCSRLFTELEAALRLWRCAMYLTPVTRLSSTRARLWGRAFIWIGKKRLREHRIQDVAKTLYRIGLTVSEGESPAHARLSDMGVPVLRIFLSSLL